MFSLHSLQDDFWDPNDYFHNSSSQKNAASDLLKKIDLYESAHVLDVGCGDGKITAEIASIIPIGKVIGLDISQAMIDFANLSFPPVDYHNLSFVLGDAAYLQYREQFDFVVSFTALQWVSDHKAFIKGAYEALKAERTLVVSMPMGLPDAMQQALNCLLQQPEWSPYFIDFSSGWNFVERDEYAEWLSEAGFKIESVEVIPQKDVFPSRAAFERFIFQWFPYLRALPNELKQEFLTSFLDRSFEIDPLPSNGEVHFKVRRLEAIAKK